MPLRSSNFHKFSARKVSKVGIVLRPNSPHIKPIFLEILAKLQKAKISCILESNSAEMIFGRDLLESMESSGGNFKDSKKKDSKNMESNLDSKANKNIDSIESKNVDVSLNVQHDKKDSKILQNLAIRDISYICNKVDMLFSIGGDGTLLSVARASYGSEVPILGINSGRLGYLTIASPSEINNVIERIKKGEYIIREHLMLEGFIQDSKENIESKNHKNQNAKDSIEINEKEASSDSLTLKKSREAQTAFPPASQCEKAEEISQQCEIPLFHKEADKRGSPPFSKKSGCFFAQRGSGEGDMRFFAQSVNENQTNDTQNHKANEQLDSIESKNVVLKNTDQQKLDSIESYPQDSIKNSDFKSQDSNLSPTHHPTIKKTKNLINKINTKDSKNKKNEWQNTHFFALNEFLLSRDDLGGMLELEAFIDGELFNHYRLDGLLVATPTGSSAYNISAGGSLVFPSCRNVLLTPVCPHALTQRPIILNDEFDMRFKFCTSGILIADGQQSIPIAKGKIVHIKVAKYGAMLVEFNTNSYFMRLRDKFGWGQSE